MTNSIYHFLLAGFLIILQVLSFQSTAQSPVWEKMQTESEGGWAEDIVVVKNRVFMSSYSALFQSLDNGASWTHVVDRGPFMVGSNGSPNSMYGTDKKIIVSGDSIFFGNQFSPDAGVTWQAWSVNGSMLPTYYYYPTVFNIKGKDLYLGTYINGFFHSPDFGKTFVAMNNGFPSYYYYETARVLEFYNGEPVVGTASGVVRWNGNSWIRCQANGLPITDIGGYKSPIIDRLRFLNSMWIASTNQGVYYSNDLGDNWQRFTDIPLITGLAPWSSYSPPAVFHNVDVHNGIIFVCYDSDVYISADAGATWQHSQLPYKVESKRIAVVGSDYLIATSAGVYKSVNGGKTWQSSNKGFELMSYRIFESRRSGDTFFSAYGKGLFKTGPDGKMLKPVNNGLNFHNVNILGASNSEVYTRMYRSYQYGGLTTSIEEKTFRSGTSALQWAPYDKFPVTYAGNLSISTNGSMVTSGNNGNSPGALFLSDDKGETWKGIFKGITHNTIKEDVVTTTLYEDDTIYVGTYYSGFYKSGDKGNSWQACSNGIKLPPDKASLADTSVVWEITSLKKSGEHFYALAQGYNLGISEGPNWLLYSQWGKQWRRISLKSIAPDMMPGFITSFLITPDGILIAVVTNEMYTENRLVVSRDHGNTWKYFDSVATPFKYIFSLGLAGDYLYVSSDKGLNRTLAPTMATMKIIAGSASGTKNEEVVVPIKVTGFQNMLGAQFSISWNQAVATFNSVEDFGLNGMNESNFGIAQSASGKITLSWNEPALNPQTLPDSSVLFSIRFRLTGFYGDSTDLKIVSDPLAIELVDKDFHEVFAKTISGALNINDAQISGKVLYGNKAPLSDIKVSLSGSSSLETTTSSDGTFGFDFIPQSINDIYTVKASHTDSNPIDGIDVADIATLRRHLLQTEILISPYALMAADVNKSKTLSTLDIILIEAMILGKIEAWPGNISWAFVPAEFVLDQTPFSYPEEIKINVSDASVKQFDFVGVKMGDVNLSYITLPGGRTSAVQDVVFDIHEETIVSESDNSKIISIPIRAQNFREVSAFQLRLRWPKEKLELIEAEGISTEVKLQKNEENSQAIIIWDSPTGKWSTVEKNESLFHLKFISTNKGDYRDLTVAESTGLAAYDKTIKPVRANVMWSKELGDGKVSIYPNPFADQVTVRFYSDDQGECNVRLLDVTGKIVNSSILQTTEGTNTFILYSTDLISGLYILEIKQGLTITRQKIIRK